MSGVVPRSSRGRSWRGRARVWTTRWRMNETQRRGISSSLSTNPSLLTACPGQSKGKLWCSPPQSPTPSLKPVSPPQCRGPSAERCTGLKITHLSCAHTPRLVRTPSPRPGFSSSRQALLINSKMSRALRFDQHKCTCTCTVSVIKI